MYILFNLNVSFNWNFLLLYKSNIMYMLIVIGSSIEWIEGLVVE